MSNPEPKTTSTSSAPQPEIAANTPTAAPLLKTPSPTPSEPAARPTPEDPVPVLDEVLGVVDTLTDAEQAEFLACEAVIELGWRTFVDVGLAFARIRAARLYKGQFDSFEAYCRDQWQYGRNYVDRLISAAQVFTNLMTFSHHRKPEHETQVRPLIGLTPEQAQLAWACAAEKAGTGKITARMVQRAVQELQLRATPAAVVQPPGPSKAEQRKSIDAAIGHLLVLVSQKAAYEVVTEKLEVLHGQIHALFANPKCRS